MDKRGRNERSNSYVQTLIRAGRLLCLSFVLLLLSTVLFPLSSSQAIGQTQRGLASYYAHRWTGRKTASGEKFHHDSLTCAHKKYPFGTILKVTNVDTDSVVYVRVNDRGPFHHRRIIDLSWAAAKKLGIIQVGVAEVIVEVCHRVVETKLPPSPSVTAPWDSLSNEPLLPWARRTGVSQK